MKSYVRSFGFSFRDKWLEGTLYFVNNQLEIFMFYAGQEYETIAQFAASHPSTPEEGKFLNEQINKLINAQ